MITVVTNTGITGLFIVSRSTRFTVSQSHISTPIVDVYDGDALTV